MTYSTWLRQALAELTKTRTEECRVYGSNSPEYFGDPVTQFIGMVANSDEDMDDISEDWEHAEDEEPIIDFDLDDYDQYHLKNPDLEEELPKEEGTEPIEQPKCYMNIQDPELPPEELEKLTLDYPTPSLGDATILDATYETSDEAHHHLLRQNDDLEVENNHLH